MIINDLRILLLEHGLEVVKTKNTIKNVGKSEQLVLLEAINNYFRIDNDG